MKLFCTPLVKLGTCESCQSNCTITRIAVLYLSNGRFVPVIRDEKLRSVPSLWEIVVPLAVHHLWIQHNPGATFHPYYARISHEAVHNVLASWPSYRHLIASAGLSVPLRFAHQERGLSYYFASFTSPHTAKLQ